MKIIILTFLFIICFSSINFAATFTVNSTSNQFDIFIGDGVCDSDQVTIGDQCTLRAAVQEANQTPDLDNINFAISGSGLQTIQLISPFPTITSPVVIDGYSQPGASPNTLAVGNDAVLKIEIRQGSNNYYSNNNLILTGGNSIVKGLLFNQNTGYSGYAMLLFRTNGGNRVEGCWFGLKPDGTNDPGRASSGIQFESPSINNYIGGLTPAERNIISNLSTAIYSSDDIVIQNNYIGTNPSGTQIRSVNNGIRVSNSSRVGGADSNARNIVVVSSSDYAVAVEGTGSTIQNNYLGVAADGVTRLGSGNGGITVRNYYSNGANIKNSIIGNIIGRFSQYGISLNESGNLGTIIKGNSIGVITDNSAIQTDSRGITIQGSNNIVGGVSGLTSGDCTGDCNVIANFYRGIVITNNGKNNQILGNSIHSNTDMGIDLGGDGITPNDFGDVDTGSNDSQNFPFIDAVSTGGTRVRGRFFGVANRSFRLEFFNTLTPDASGYGEGQIYVGAMNVVTDANGRADFDQTFTYNSLAGSYVTSTATDLTTLNTSEFSFAIQVQFVTTAASVTVGGRVMTKEGRGIRNVVITMTDSNGNTRTTASSINGFYRFTDVAAGETYIFSAHGKRFSFRNNSQVYSILEDTDDINFVTSNHQLIP